MPPQIEVILGPAGSGKTQGLLAQYAASLTGGGAAAIGRALWLSPSGRAAELIREQLAERLGSACLLPGVTTFRQLAEQVFATATVRRRRIPRVLQRELLRRVVAVALGAKELSFYADAAQRAGFIDLLASHFRELQQRDISPQAYERITSARGASPRQRELSRLYSAYIERLSARDLIDAEGIQLAARDALATGKCTLFSNLELLVVDGFTDFTHVELDTLRLLADCCKNVGISLLGEEALAVAGGRRAKAPTAHSPRADLFAKTSATLVELERLFPQLTKRWLAPRPAANVAIGYLAEQVFQHPHPVPPQPVVNAMDAVELVAATSEQDEIIQLARRIKRLLSASSTKPGDVVVVFRSVAEVAPRVEEVFSRFGIPYAIETTPRLARAPVLRTLQSLLRLHAESWPFRRVVGAVTNTMLTVIDSDARRAADWFVRELQIASGRESLLTAVRDLAALHDQRETLSEHQQHRVDAATRALPALERLSESLEKLPRNATTSEWAAALESLGVALGIPLFSGAARNDSERSTENESVDGVAWNVVSGHLHALDRFDAELGEARRTHDCREFLALWADITTKEFMPRLCDEPGRVRVLAAQSARAVPAKHLFLAGMSEQAFPASPPSGRLANDSDYRFLAAAAQQKANPRTPSKPVETPSARVHSQDEMLLFYEVLARARETLTISYPAMDDKAQELPPSPYVIELQRIFRAGEQPIRHTAPQLSPIPHHAAAALRDGNPRPSDSAVTIAGLSPQIFSRADWRIAATAEAAQTEGDLRLLAGLFSSEETRRVGQAIDSGIRIIHARAHGETFGPCEGVLVSPAIAKRLAQRFGNKHTWSPSQFETYAACPYKFFLGTVLGLEPLGDLTLETDFARRGSLLHHVLASFHRKYGESPSEWSAVWHDQSRFSAELKHALQNAFAATPREGIEAALLELDRRQIDKWTDLYREQHEKYHGAWLKLSEPPTPTHFELRFGRKHAGEEGLEDPSSVDNSFRLDIGSEKIHIAGRIDRIDVGRVGDHTVFNVIDYKSGKRPTLTSDKIESGERLQPALYVMAAQALVFGEDGATPLWAGYWSLQNGVTTHKSFSLHCSVESGELTDAWNKLKPKVIARIGDIVRAARRGDFPINSSDQHCTSFCDFRTVCRVAQVRSVGKIWAPPGDA